MQRADRTRLQGAAVEAGDVGSHAAGKGTDQAALNAIAAFQHRHDAPLTAPVGHLCTGTRPLESATQPLMQSGMEAQGRQAGFLEPNVSTA